ncbi:Spo0E like sporulation regulatory protein [Clostridium sp. USBA 49]|uniref:aspartyl-phosphate phosphatase Spo0E family protein n=1 Tax=Clostridium TaxID=1485 RepID=UPI0009994066|nr:MULTISPECIES: aspartyl-phosphate phosphatase Spo0E family protein [Clostridium]SKA72819.1 Spo0E like sporulation regulatory protein [Clostridium sp. USBA 49]
MELQIQILSKKIDNLRSILYGLISSNNLTDKSVVKCSQQLDKLLVEYEICKKNYYT